MFNSILLLFKDGDLVTVFDSQDLSFALQTSRVLKLQVFMNNLSNQERINPKLNAEDFRKQLREIRDAVTWLLDTCEVTNEENNMPNSIRNNYRYYVFKCVFTFCFFFL